MPGDLFMLHLGSVQRDAQTTSNYAFSFAFL